MTVLSDAQALDALKRGEIVIDPFDPKSLATSSYDIRLGPFYFEEIPPPRTPYIQIFNPYDQEHVDKVWGTTHKTAKPAWATLADLDAIRTPLNNIHPDNPIILLPPRATILAHSLEFIGGARYHTSMMKARSSFGRSFIEVCKCAGWGDIGYFNRWTMEITNNSSWRWIPLPVGRRIAQIAFLQSGPLLQADYGLSGSYQQSDKLSEVKSSWHPNMMKPQLPRDRDIQDPPYIITEEY